MLFCPFKHILGHPKTGLHKLRMVGDTAMFDYIGTLLIAFFITYQWKIPLEISTIFVFVFSMLLHWLFCVSTNSNRWLGLV